MRISTFLHHRHVDYMTFKHSGGYLQEKSLRSGKSYAKIRNMNELRFDVSVPDAQNKRKQTPVPLEQTSKNITDLGVNSQVIEANSTQASGFSDSSQGQPEPDHKAITAVSAPSVVTEGADSAPSRKAAEQPTDATMALKPPAAPAPYAESDSAVATQEAGVTNAQNGSTAQNISRSAEQAPVFHSKEIGTKTVKKEDPFKKQNQDRAQRKKLQVKQLKIALPIVAVVVAGVVALTVFLIVKNVSQSDQLDNGGEQTANSPEEAAITNHVEAAQNLYEQSDPDSDTIANYFEEQSSQDQPVIGRNNLYIAEMTAYADNEYYNLALEAADQVDTRYLTNYQYVLLYGTLADIYYQRGDQAKGDYYIGLLEEKGLVSKDEELNTSGEVDYQTVQDEIDRVEAEKEQEEE